MLAVLTPAQREQAVQVPRGLTRVKQILSLGFHQPVLGAALQQTRVQAPRAGKTAVLQVLVQAATRAVKLQVLQVLLLEARAAKILA